MHIFFAFSQPVCQLVSNVLRIMRLHLSRIWSQIEFVTLANLIIAWFCPSLHEKTRIRYLSLILFLLLPLLPQALLRRPWFGAPWTATWWTTPTPPWAPPSSRTRWRSPSWPRSTLARPTSASPRTTTRRRRPKPTSPSTWDVRQITSICYWMKSF